MRFGAENKKALYALVVLGIGATYGVYSRFLARPVSAPAPAVVSVSDPYTEPAPRASSDNGRIEEFKPQLRAKRAEERIDQNSVDPTLRLDLLAKLQEVPEAAGSHNLFQIAPAPSKEALPTGTEPVIAISRNWGPRPLPESEISDDEPPAKTAPIDVKYYGWAGGGDRKKALFLDGDDVVAKSEGETLQGRYRVVSITPTSVVVEDSSDSLLARTEVPLLTATGEAVPSEEPLVAAAGGVSANPPNLPPAAPTVLERVTSAYTVPKPASIAATAEPAQPKALAAPELALAVPAEPTAADVRMGAAARELAATRLAPSIVTGGVVNGASFSGPLVRGGLATVFGSNLAESTAGADAVPLPTTLEGVQVTVGGIAAPLVYVSPTQINFQTPFEAPVSGAVPIVVTVNGASSDAQIATMAEYAPAVFTVPVSGTNEDSPPTIAPVIVHGSDNTLVTSSHPASANEVVVVYATGVGTFDHSPATGAASPASPLAACAMAPTVTVGGLPAQVLFAGLTPGFVGLVQMNIQLPEKLPVGGNLPVSVQFGNASSQSVSLNVNVSGPTAAGLVTASR